MSNTFFGKWSLKVTGGDVHEFDQRVRIHGSLNADGIHPLALGTQIPAIDGTVWQITSERSADHGKTWQENVVQRITTSTPPSGWTVTLYGDDDVVKPQFSDIFIELVYLNPQINPQFPPPPFSFTAPRGARLPPPACCDCCCHTPCRCRPRLAIKLRRGCGC
jgi:hypothetical protein